MKIAIFGHNQSTQYSGGRYLSWMMAEALAYAGHEVVYVTNARPLFCADFAAYPHDDKIRLQLTRDFLSDLPEEKFDFVMVIPHPAKDLSFFKKAEYFAVRTGARLGILSFETPNWFNSLAPEPKDADLWDGWKYIAQRANLVYCMAEEAVKFAREYYHDCPPETLIAACHCPINSVVADSVPAAEREKRIVLLSRFERSAHKGADGIGELLGEAMRGYTLVIIIGQGRIPDETLADMQSKCERFGIEIEILNTITDSRKFAELKRASLVLFPSLFEGFGLPPIEAQYCNTPCIAFDLPVLREINGEGIEYVERGNWPAFRERIGAVLERGSPASDLREKIAPIARFENYAERLNKIVEEAAARAVPPLLAAQPAQVLLGELKSPVGRESKSEPRPRADTQAQTPGRPAAAVSRAAGGGPEAGMFARPRRIVRRFLRNVADLLRHDLAAEREKRHARFDQQARQLHEHLRLFHQEVARLNEVTRHLDARTQKLADEFDLEFVNHNREMILHNKSKLAELTNTLSEHVDKLDVQYADSRAKIEAQVADLASQRADFKKLAEKFAAEMTRINEMTRWLDVHDKELKAGVDTHRSKIEAQVADLASQRADFKAHAERFAAEMARLNESMRRLDEESLFILRTSFDEDPWLAGAKDSHKGERCFLLACGPSLNRVDLTRLAGEHVMGVNGTIMLETVELEYFITVSRYFWEHHREAIERASCKRVFLPSYVPLNPAAPTTRLRAIPEEIGVRAGAAVPWFFSKQADRYVVLGGSVLGPALQILYHLGFSEVIVLGLDHDYGLTEEEKKIVGGFKKSTDTLDAHFAPNYYQRGKELYIDMRAAERAYELAHEAYLADGRRILNASPGTKLATFPVVEFDALFPVAST